MHADVSVSACMLVCVCVCMCVCAACSWYTQLMPAVAHRDWWTMQRDVARGWQLLQPLSTACLGRGSAGRSRAKSSRNRSSGKGWGCSFQKSSGNRSSGKWWGCRKEFREQISDGVVGKSSGNRSVMGMQERVQGTDQWWGCRKEFREQIIRQVMGL